MIIIIIIIIILLLLLILIIFIIVIMIIVIVIITILAINKREKTFFHEYLQEACLVLTESPKVSGNLREFSGECNLGIL